MRRLFFLFALFLGLSGPATADRSADPQIAPSRVADELRAIGRVRPARSDADGCSAVLVAPQLAVTAAHCVARIPAPIMNPRMFIVGPDQNPPLFRIRVTSIAHHAEYATVERSFETLYTDLAVLHLEAPVPADIATPIPLADGLQPLRVAIYGYVNGRRDTLFGHPECALGIVRPGVLGSDCTVVSGFSGTAVLSGPPGERRLEGIAVARLPDDRVRSLIADVVPWPRFTDDTPAPNLTPSATGETSP